MRNMKDECQKSFGTVIEKSEETNPLLSAAHREQYVDKALLPKLKSLSVTTSSSLPTSWPRILVFVFVESRPPPSHSKLQSLASIPPWSLLSSRRLQKLPAFERRKNVREGLDLTTDAQAPSGVGRHRLLDARRCDRLDEGRIPRERKQCPQL